MRKAIFEPIDLLYKSEDFGPNFKFSNKNGLHYAWRDFKKRAYCSNIYINCAFEEEKVWKTNKNFID